MRQIQGNSVLPHTLCENTMSSLYLFHHQAAAAAVVVERQMGFGLTARDMRSWSTWPVTYCWSDDEAFRECACVCV